MSDDESYEEEMEDVPKGEGEEQASDPEDDGVTQMLKTADPPEVRDPGCAANFVARNARTHTFLCAISLLTLFLALPLRSLSDAYNVSNLVYDQYNNMRDVRSNALVVLNTLTSLQEASVFYAATSNGQFSNEIEEAVAQIGNMSQYFTSSFVPGTGNTVQSAVKELTNYASLLSSSRASYSSDTPITNGILVSAVESSASDITNDMDTFRILLERYPYGQAIGLNDSADVRLYNMNLTLLFADLTEAFAVTRTAFYTKDLLAESSEQFVSDVQRLVQCSLSLQSVASNLYLNGVVVTYGTPAVTALPFTMLEFNLYNASVLAASLVKKISNYATVSLSSSVASWVMSNSRLPLSQLLAQFSPLFSVQLDVHRELTKLSLAWDRQSDELNDLQNGALSNITATVITCCIISVAVFAYMFFGIGLRHRVSLLAAHELTTYSGAILIGLIGMLILIAFMARKLVQQASYFGNVFDGVEALYNATDLMYAISTQTLYGALGVNVSAFGGRVAAVDPLSITLLLNNAQNSLASIPNQARTLQNVSFLLSTLHSNQSAYDSFLASVTTLQQYGNSSIGTYDELYRLVASDGARAQQSLSIACGTLEATMLDAGFYDERLAIQQLRQNLEILQLTLIQSVLAAADEVGVYRLGLDNALVALETTLRKVNANYGTEATYEYSGIGLLLTQWLALYNAPARAILTRQTYSLSMYAQINNHIALLLGIAQSRQHVASALSPMIDDQEASERSQSSHMRRVIVWLCVFTVWVAQIGGYVLWRCLFPKSM